MAKTILITNKAYGDLKGTGKDYCHDSGVAYTNDRYFSIVNETFDYHLKLKSRFLSWFVNFWYYTTDYKKKPSLANKKFSRAKMLETLIFWICLIGLIICLITGVAVPIIQSATKSILLIQGKALGAIYANNILVGYVFTNAEAAGILASTGHSDVVTTIGSNKFIIQLTSQMQQWLYEWFLSQHDKLGSLSISQLSPSHLILNTDQTGQALIIPIIWSAWFAKADVIIPIIICIILIVVIYLYNYRKKKLLPKINNLSVQDYLTTKLLFVKRFHFILKRKVPMIKGIKELNHRFIYAIDALGTTQIYYDIRLMNYIYSTFSDMNCIMCINVTDDTTIELLQKIIMQDFSQNINLIIVDTENLQDIKSTDGYGYLFNNLYQEKLNQEPISWPITNIQDKDLDLKIKYQETIQATYEHKLNEQINIINKKIEKLVLRNKRTLNDSERRKILEKIVFEYETKKKILIDNYNDFKKLINAS